MHQINFQAGLNDGRFIVSSLNVEIPFSIYFLSQNSRLVVTDIDGTITNADLKHHSMHSSNTGGVAARRRQDVALPIYWGLARSIRCG